MPRAQLRSAHASACLLCCFRSPGGRSACLASPRALLVPDCAVPHSRAEGAGHTAAPLPPARRLCRATE